MRTPEITLCEVTHLIEQLEDRILVAPIALATFLLATPYFFGMGMGNRG